MHLDPALRETILDLARNQFFYQTQPHDDNAVQNYVAGNARLGPDTSAAVRRARYALSSLVKERGDITRLSVEDLEHFHYALAHAHLIVAAAARLGELKRPGGISPGDEEHHAPVVPASHQAKDDYLCKMFSAVVGIGNAIGPEFLESLLAEKKQAAALSPPS